jgi:hypothetical protein
MYPPPPLRAIAAERKMNKLIILLAVGLTLQAAGALAQEHDVYAYTTIPAWVKIDRAAFSESMPVTNAPDRAYASLTHVAVEYPGREAPVFRAGWAGKLYNPDAYRVAERPSNLVFPSESDIPPFAYRPSVGAPGGWKLSMPNVKKNVAKLLLQRKF